MKNRKQQSKFGQVEIMGLLIIVILVVVVIFLVVSFSAKTPPRTIHTTYMNDQMSTSFILALLDTSTECGNSVSLSEVIADCAAFNRIDCPGGSSCDYLNDSLSEIFNSTLVNWGVGFQFKINHLSFNKPEYGNFTFSQGCGYGSMVQRETFQIIPLYPRPDDIKVRIKICGN